MTAPRVLIISGPIASGKSTVAQSLATESRAASSTAAVVELDRMYMMLDDSPLMSDPRISRRARRAAAALVDHYVLDGLDLIIAEGDFWTADQRQEFTYWLSSGIAPGFVTLHVSVEEALRRVESDANRRLSRIPEVLRRASSRQISPAVAGERASDSSVSPRMLRKIANGHGRSSQLSSIATSSGVCTPAFRAAEIATASRRSAATCSG